MEPLAAEAINPTAVRETRPAIRNIAENAEWKAAEKAERKTLRDAYKAECEAAAGVEVTNLMIAEKAFPKSKNPLAKFYKWFQCHPSMGGWNDRCVRKVFEEKPHLQKQSQAPTAG
jgi:hypothetical protein